MRLRPREIHLLILSVDLFILNASFFLVRLFLDEGDPDCIKNLLIVLNIGYVIVSPVFVENLRDLKSDYPKMARSLVRRFVYYFAFTALILLFIDQTACPKRQYLTTISLFFLLKFCVSSWFFFRYFFNTHLYLKPTIIIGDNKLGSQLQDYFLTNKYLGIAPIGLLADRPAKDPNHNVIGSVSDFQKIFDTRPFEDAFIVLPLSEVEKIKNLIAVAERNGVRTHLVPNFAGSQEMHFKVGSLGDIPLLQMRTFPLDTYANRFLKRAFDIGFASFMILCLLPLGLLIAIAIKLTGKGPIFFKTHRLGVTGAPFTIYKFRTMIYQPTPDNQLHSTVQNDRRITRLGKFLRKYSLDELPQLLNVLTNDMSIVGPRPHRLNLNKTLQQKMGPYMMRHTIKPGITGWAQVNGWRGPTETKLQYWGRTLHDLWYIEHWNFWLDLYIILLTLVGKKTRKNAF
ncbi:MAG TPA: exopolysaccharide biosynthesis polyprenyl glycosylphosphotransferase [Puia sp.]|nr:exopolysaccharide biosynthesis polyprenyl glycosylphosphotransferase [Puia sp.]